MAINASAFGPNKPDAGAVATSAAIKAAPGVLKYATTGNTSDLLGAGLSALTPALGALGDEGRMAGNALSAGMGAFNAGKAMYDAASGAAMSAATGGLGTAFSLWNIPQFAQTLQNLFDPETESIMRRFNRDRDAAGLQSDVLRSVHEGLQSRNMRGALDRDVGGARVGDTLASVLNYNLSGGWTPGGDTDLHWRPNPGLLGLQQLLHNAGYRGTTADESGIQWREGMKGDVGGVGEMVLSGGRGLVANNPEWAKQYEGTPRWDDVSGPDFTSTHLANLHGSPGAAGWDRYLRGLSSLFGMPVTTPDVFRLDDAPVNVNPVGDPAIAAQHPIMGPAPEYAQYLSALDETMPEAAARVREGDQRRAGLRDVQQWVAGGGGTG
jgi:hypothetical protein